MDPVREGGKSRGVSGCLARSRGWLSSFFHCLLVDGTGFGFDVQILPPQGFQCSPAVVPIEKAGSVAAAIPFQPAAAGCCGSHPASPLPEFFRDQGTLVSRMCWLRIGRIGAPAALSAGYFCFTAAPTCRTGSFCSALAPPWRRDHHRPSGGIPPPWQCPPERLGHCSTSFPRDKIRDGSSS